MALKRRTTRLNPGATPTLVPNTHTTTSVTNAQIQAMIDEGVTVALAARDATRNGDNIHTSGTGARMPVQVAHKRRSNTWAERQLTNKRKSDDTARNNQNQQPNKRQNTGRAYATGNGDRRPYKGPRPLEDSLKAAESMIPRSSIEFSRVVNPQRGWNGKSITNEIEDLE
ncbi:hypothetical protein Tco_0890096 [Tanacetum coccineum]